MPQIIQRGAHRQGIAQRQILCGAHVIRPVIPDLQHSTRLVLHGRAPEIHIDRTTERAAAVESALRPRQHLDLADVVQRDAGRFARNGYPIQIERVRRGYLREVQRAPHAADIDFGGVVLLLESNRRHEVLNRPNIRDAGMDQRLAVDGRDCRGRFLLQLLLLVRGYDHFLQRTGIALGEHRRRTGRGIVLLSVSGRWHSAGRRIVLLVGSGHRQRAGHGIVLLSGRGRWHSAGRGIVLLVGPGR